MTGRSKQNKKLVVSRTKLDDFIYWSIAVFFFILPLTIFPMTAEIFELPKVTLLRIFVLFIIFLWVAKFYQTGSIVFYRTFLDLPVLFFVGVATIATVFSINPMLSLVGSYYRYEGLPTILSYIVIFFVITNFVRDVQRVTHLLYVLIASAVITSLYGIFQHFGLDFLTLSGKVFELTRSSGTFGNPIFLGAFLVLLAPVGIILAINAEQLWKRLVFLVCVLVLLTCLVFTNTRGSWLGFMFSSVIFSIGIIRILSPRREKMRERKMILSVILLALIVIVLFSSLYAHRLKTTSVFYRIVSAFQKGGSVATRLDMWIGAMKILRDRPILGYGWETFEGVFPKYASKFLMSVEELPDRPHNQFLYIGSSAGIMGWLALLWVLITIFWKVVARFGSTFVDYKSSKNIKRRRTSLNTQEDLLLVGLIAGIVAYIVQEQFSFSLAGVTPVFWAFLSFATLIGEKDKGGEGNSQLVVRMNRSYRLGLILLSLILIIIGIIFNVRFFAADYNFKVWVMRETKDTPPDLALNRLEKAVELNPFISKYRIALIQAYAGLATTTGDAQWTQQAIEVAEDGILFNPRDEALWINLGDLHFYQPMEKSSYAKAQLAYERVLKLHPNSAAARWALGDVNQKLGNYEEAIQELEEARKLVPHHTGILYSLGLAFEGAGRFKEAKNAFRKVLELDPKNQKAKKALQRLRNSL